MGAKSATLPQHELGRTAVKLARQAGWEVDQTERGHWRIHAPGREVPIIFGSTPSDEAAMHQALAQMHKAGVEAAIKECRRERKAGTPRKRRAGENKLPANLKFDAKRFAEAVFQARIAQGWSQRDVCDQLGWGSSRLSPVENQGNYSMDTVYGLMKLFRWNDFYGEEPWEPERTPEVAASNGIGLPHPASAALVEAEKLAHPMQVVEPKAPAPRRSARRVPTVLPEEPTEPAETREPAELNPYLALLDSASAMMKQMRTLRAELAHLRGLHAKGITPQMHQLHQEIKQLHDERDEWKRRAETAETMLEEVTAPR